MAQFAPPSTLDNLSRLASKPGVQSTLILSKVDGAIIRSTGLQSASPQATPTPSDFRSSAASTDGSRPGLADSTATDLTYGSTQQSNENSAEDVAKMVFSFVTSAGGLVSGLDASNEVQLLRLRTRKNEIVIVPDSKYLLVVIHDPPKQA